MVVVRKKKSLGWNLDQILHRKIFFLLDMKESMLTSDTLKITFTIHLRYQT